MNMNSRGRGGRVKEEDVEPERRDSGGGDKLEVKE